MKINDALKIFELENIEDINNFELSKIYKKIALKVHPDKGGNAEKFKDLTTAYDMLKTLNELNNVENNNNNKINILNQMIINVNNFYNNNVHVKQFVTIFTNKINNYINRIINNMNYNDLIKINEILKKCDFLINNNILDIVENKIKQINSQENHEKIEHVSISANINDIINDNLYYFTYNNTRIIIPLWHSELYYEVEDISNNKIGLIVNINTTLPNNMYLDEMNNLHVNISKKLENTLLYEDIIEFKIADKLFNINVNDIYIKDYQEIVLKGQGPCKINYDFIYTTTSLLEGKKGDIIVHLKLY